MSKSKIRLPDGKIVESVDWKWPINISVGTKNLEVTKIGTLYEISSFQGCEHDVISFIGLELLGLTFSPDLIHLGFYQDDIKSLGPSQKHIKGKISSQPNK